MPPDSLNVATLPILKLLEFCLCTLNIEALIALLGLREDPLQMRLSHYKCNYAFKALLFRQLGPRKLGLILRKRGL
jgi:hypothetical protein